MSNQTRIASDQRSIVYFDGVCGLCNTSVDWVLLKDRDAKFLFAPLQGSSAAQNLSESERRDLDTIILFKNGRTFKRSDAIGEVLLELKTPWRQLGLCLLVIPRPLRNFGYDLVARVRYVVFGQRDVCRIPTPEERSRFRD